MIATIRFLWRLRVHVLLHRLDEPLKKRSWLFRLWLFILKPRPKATQPTPERLNAFLEDMGAIFIKLGQFLSSRPDVVPNHYQKSLSKLQDNCKTLPFATIKRLVQEAYDAPLASFFQNISETPLASGSIAQVHEASLCENGEKVVLKIVKPPDASVRDLMLFYRLTKIGTFFSKAMRQYHLPAIFDIFKKQIEKERDMVYEASNASLMAHYFKENPHLKIPKVNWLLTRNRVLVMEKMEGMRFSAVDAISSLDKKTLAHHGVNIFLEQVFLHNFFHADMHGGNLLIDSNMRLISLDFGIVASLHLKDRLFLAQFILYFLNHDYEGMSIAFLQYQKFKKPIDYGVIVEAMRSIHEPVFHKSFGDSSMSDMLVRLIRFSREHDIALKPRLILLHKTILNVETLAKTLDPELDLWRSAKPFLEKWLRKNLNPLRNWDQMKKIAQKLWFEAASNLEQSKTEAKKFLFSHWLQGVIPATIIAIAILLS